MLMRLPEPGAMPRDGLVSAEYKPGYSRQTGHHYWGIVVYNRKLTDEEVYHYDLELMGI